MRSTTDLSLFDSQLALKDSYDRVTSSSVCTTKYLYVVSNMYQTLGSTLFSHEHIIEGKYRELSNGILNRILALFMAICMVGRTLT